MNNEISECPNCQASLSSQEIQTKFEEVSITAIRFECSKKCGYGRVDLPIEPKKVDSHE
jgi:valyl-tRNA synthetase